MTTHYFICLGDRTSGGGVVVEGNVRHIILGRPAASVGMKVLCCNRPQKIMNGWSCFNDHGKLIAYHGCLLSCGHRLIASQNLSGWSDDQDDSALPEQIISKPQRYHEFFTLKDDDSQPVEGQKYRLSAEDGSVLEGYTNAKGQTEYLWTHEKLPVNLEIVDDEEEAQFDHYHITDQE